MYTVYAADDAPSVPAAELFDSAGRVVSLEDYWPNAELTAFALTRHFG